MRVPLELQDQSKFIAKARAKNLKIESNFTGVYLEYNANRKCWTSRVQQGNKVVKFERFPLTAQGEQAAGDFYVYWREQIKDGRTSKLAT
jgi:hypothetical protein